MSDTRTGVRAHIGLELLVVLIREVLELGRHGAPSTRPVRQCRAQRLARSNVFPSTSRGSNDDTHLSVQEKAFVASSIALRYDKDTLLSIV